MTVIDQKEANSNDARHARLDEGLTVIEGGANKKAEVKEPQDVGTSLAGLIVAFSFGDTFKSGLTPLHRRLVAIGALAAQGGREHELAEQVRSALDIGAKAGDIVEAISHVAVYCGFEAAGPALHAVRQVLAERNLLPAGRA